MNSENDFSRTKKKTSQHKKIEPSTSSEWFTDEQLLRALAEAIRERRLSLKMKQRELARCADLDRGYIVDVEGGARNLSIANISRLAAALQFKCASELVAAAERKLTKNRHGLRIKFSQSSQSSASD